MNLPNRIFLDTNVINLIVEHSDFVFEEMNLDERLNDRLYHDLLGIRQIFRYANHNTIEIVVSETSFAETRETKDAAKRRKLEIYCNDIFQSFQSLVEDDFTKHSIQKKYLQEYLIERGFNKLIDANDRSLIIEALIYKCDVFCTRDWSVSSPVFDCTGKLIFCI
jgi:hypothetical protein